MERIEDFSIPVIYSTCTSGAGVASGKREARRKTVGRLVCTWRRRVGAPIPPPFSVYALCAPCHPLSVRGADGGRGNVGRRGSEASFGVWGRPTAEPCFSRPANSRAEPSSRSRSSSSSSSFTLLATSGRSNHANEAPPTPRSPILAGCRVQVAALIVYYRVDPGGNRVEESGGSERSRVRSRGWPREE